MKVKVEVKALTRHLVSKYLKSNEEYSVEFFSSPGKETCERQLELWEKIIDDKVEGE